jgi:Ca2+-binding EF-hand superfamily protein
VSECCLSVQAREAALKKEHTAYLDEHPEVKRLLNDYVAAALVEQPADVFAFAREHFRGTATAVDEFVADDEGADPDDQDDLDDMLEEAEAGSELRVYLKSVFDAIDTDGSGSISQAELAKKMKVGCRPKIRDTSAPMHYIPADRTRLAVLTAQEDTELQNLLASAGGDPLNFVFEQLDLDGDGQVTWQEFEAMLGDL